MITYRIQLLLVESCNQEDHVGANRLDDGVVLAELGSELVEERIRRLELVHTHHIRDQLNKTLKLVSKKIFKSSLYLL